MTLTIERLAYAVLLPAVRDLDPSQLEPRGRHCDGRNCELGEVVGREVTHRRCDPTKPNTFMPRTRVGASGSRQDRAGMSRPIVTRVRLLCNPDCGVSAPYFAFSKGEWKGS